MVRDVVGQVASEELPLVEGLFRFDDATVVRRLSGRGRRREPLGFGVGEVVALVTPVVWLAVDRAAKLVGDAAADRAARGAGALLRRVLRRRAEPVTVPPLTREQLGEVRERVLQTAVQRGVPEQRATAIADAVVTRLALATPEVAGPARPDSGAGNGIPST